MIYIILLFAVLLLLTLLKRWVRLSLAIPLVIVAIVGAAIITVWVS